RDLPGRGGDAARPGAREGLGGLQEPDDLGAAHGTGALGSLAAVRHLDLFALELPLLAALHAVRLVLGHLPSFSGPRRTSRPLPRGLGEDSSLILAGFKHPGASGAEGPGPSRRGTGPGTARPCRSRGSW